MYYAHDAVITILGLATPLDVRLFTAIPCGRASLSIKATAAIELYIEQAWP